MRTARLNKLLENKKWSELNAKQKDKLRNMNGGFSKEDYKSARQTRLGNEEASPENSPSVRSGKKYFSDVDPGEKLGKNEIKNAVDSGLSYHKINKYVNKSNAVVTKKGSDFLAKKLGQVSTKIKDYDPTTAGGKGFGKKDVKYLMSDEGGGHSIKKIEKHVEGLQKDSDTKVGSNLSSFIEKYKARQKQKNENAEVIEQPLPPSQENTPNTSETESTVTPKEVEKPDYDQVDAVNPNIRDKIRYLDSIRKTGDYELHGIALPF